MGTRLYRDLLATTILVVTSVGLVAVHGFHGFAPHDQSIVFDGAWRILHHQVPYVDFVMPNGALPMVMQSLVFATAGVSWFTYVAHAAVLNGLYALLIWRGLRVTGLDGASSFLYALGAGVLLYPPIGVPFMDQHAFFFVGCLMVTVVVICTRQEGRLGWVLPILVLAGALSKQIPSAFALPALAIPLITLPSPERRRYIQAIVVAGAVTTALFAVVLVAFGIDTSLVWRYAVYLPGSVGEDRLGDLATMSPGTQLRRLAVAFGVGGFSSMLSAAVLALSSAMVAGALWVFRKTIAATNGILPLALAAAWTFPITAGFMALTNNQLENGLALAPLAYGLTHAALLRIATLADRQRRLIRLGAFVLPVVFTVQVMTFHATVVVPRTVNDMSYSGEPSCDGLPRELEGLRWATPHQTETLCAEFAELVSYLREPARPLWVIGDSLILYALSGQISPLPTVFYHRGLTIPIDEPAHTEFEDWLLRNLSRLEVTRIVTEGPVTLMGAALQDFPRAAARIRDAECGRRTFGGFEVVELCQPDWLPTVRVESAR